MPLPLGDTGVSTDCHQKSAKMKDAPPQSSPTIQLKKMSLKGLPQLMERTSRLNTHNGTPLVTIRSCQQKTVQLSPTPIPATNTPVRIRSSMSYLPLDDLEKRTANRRELKSLTSLHTSKTCHIDASEQIQRIRLDMDMW